MELTNAFTVDVPIERAWEVLTDVPTIAPCLPGAQLQEVEGDEFRGVLKVKVGPITAQYKGAAQFLEREEGAHRAVIRAEGRETRGQGNAQATITAQLVPSGDSTEVTVTTDLTVTGKVAQLGRGVMADVSAKLMATFADNLRTTVLDGGTAAASAASAASAEPAPAAAGSGNGSGPPVPSDGGASAPAGPAVRALGGPEPEPVDLLGAAGGPLLRRLVPVAVVAVVLLVVLRLMRRRRRT